MNHKTFTKKDFAAGMRCIKSLYLNHHPEIAVPDPDNNSLAIMEAGKAFELSVRDLIAPNGIDLTEVEDNQDKRIERTKRELRKKNCVLYQATFQNNSGEFCMTDILIKKGNHIQIIEVKSVTKINEENYYDAAFQYHVITSSGVTVEFKVCYVNKDYIMKESLTSDIFIMEDVTKVVKKVQPRIQKNIERFKKVLDRKDIFEKEIGEFCFKSSPCQYQKYCMQGLPANNVFEFRSMHLIKKLNLHYKGYTRMEDAIASNRIKFTDGQIIQATSALENKIVIQYDKLREWLDQFRYCEGIFYLDFESVNPLVPKIGQKSLTGLKPYTQVPFQYSLHYKCKKSNNKLMHMDFVEDPDLGDPREEFLKKLIFDLSLFEDAPIVVYSSFEENILKNLIHVFPDYEYDIRIILMRIVDMMDVFKKKWYYHPDFRGSYSIKSVLPVLCPEMSYKNLKINNGAQASAEYMRLSHLPKEEAEKKIDELKQYCFTDTLAMVRILEELEIIAYNNRGIFEPEKLLYKQTA